MKAILQDRYGAADVLALKDIDAPVVGDHDVLVQVHAASAHIGDWHLMAGEPYLVRAALGLRGPRQRVRGMDLAGRVLAVGKAVTQFHPGDEVFGSGTGAFAELACAREDKLARKPANLTFQQAAALATSGSTALQALAKGPVGPGQKVLIIGAAGAVGGFAVQLAKAAGAHVTGVCSPSKIDLVRSLGADAVIDYTRDDFTAGAQHYDLIVDTAGNRPLAQLRRALSTRGTLVLVGGEGGGRWFGGMGRPLWAALVSPFVKHRLSGLISIVRKDDLLHLAALCEAGKLSPVIDRTYALDGVPDAIRYIAEGHARGKVVIAVAASA